MDAKLDLKNELEVFIQPIFNSDNLELIGGEALIRSKKCNKNTAESALDIIAKNKLELDLDYFVLKTICTYLKNNENMSGEIAFNISRKTIESIDGTQELLRILNDCGKVNRLTVELNENTAFSNATVQNNIKLLSDIGLRIAIDDFGMSDISLVLATQHKINTIKMDRIMLEKMNNRKLKTLFEMTNMLKHLDIGIVIEGIEFKNQLDFARSIGKCKLQGYLLGKPLMIEDYLKLYCI